MKKNLSKLITMTFYLCAVTFIGKTTAQDVVWKKNFGGGTEWFADVITVPDGYVAVGGAHICVNIGGYWHCDGSGDWKDLTGKGEKDAIIVKFDKAGNCVWKKNLGVFGSLEGTIIHGQPASFSSVTAVSDGYVAVGYVGNNSWGSKVCNLSDFKDLPIKGKYGFVAIIVKFSFTGQIVWMNNFNGVEEEYKEEIGSCFNRVIAVDNDALIVVGYSYLKETANKYDWEGYTGFGGAEAIIVKYNHNGIVSWKNKIGGKGTDAFTSVTAVEDGYIAVGYDVGSENTGDWLGSYGKNYATIVKYSLYGSMVWKKRFGGDNGSNNGYGSCRFNCVTTVSDGVIAGGYTPLEYFGYGDWEDYKWTDGNGSGIAIKFGLDGKILKKCNPGFYQINSIIPVNDGFFCNELCEYCSDVGYMSKLNYDFEPHNNHYWHFTYDCMTFWNLAADVNSVVIVGYKDTRAHSWCNYFQEGFSQEGGSALIVKFNIKGGYISGYVKDEKNGTKSISKSGVENPAKDVDVYLLQQKSQWDTVSIATTTEDGFFAFGGLSAGNYRVVLKIPGAEMLNTVDINMCEDGTYKNLVLTITDEGVTTTQGNAIIEPKTEKDNITVYPNPTTGELRIELRQAQLPNGELRINGVEIFDVMGRKIPLQFIEGVDGAAGRGSKEGWQPKADGVVMNISHLTSGIYLIKITTENGIVTKKIIKQ